MGIIIAIDPASPRSDGFGIVMALRCDECPGLFVVSAEFRHDAGFVGCHSDAMAAGWLERQAPTGRTWVCPGCSGKAPQ